MWEKNREIREMALFGSQGYEGVENKLWFDGKGDKLEYFYKKYYLPFSAYNSQDRFWRVVNTRMPELISIAWHNKPERWGTYLIKSLNSQVDGGQKKSRNIQQRLR